MSILRDMPIDTPEQVLAFRKAALAIEQDAFKLAGRDQLKNCGSCRFNHIFFEVADLPFCSKIGSCYMFSAWEPKEKTC
jgi:hypothetical protein